jgi:hypothetical protein
MLEKKWKQMCYSSDDLTNQKQQPGENIYLRYRQLTSEIYFAMTTSGYTTPQQN